MDGNKKKSTDLEEVLKSFRLCGRYHMKALILIFLAFASNSLYCSNYVFVTPLVGYSCRDDTFYNNTCGMNNDGLRCVEWVYDDPNSFAAEFELACEDWKITLVGSVHSFAYMIGLLLVGPLSDKFGRKPTAIVTGFLGGVFGLARSFTNNYWLYLIFEFLESAIGDSCSPLYMLSMELTSSDKRLTYHMWTQYGFVAGNVLLALSAWLVPYWRSLLQVLYAPALLFLLYIYLLDECPRWLLSKGQKEEAAKILKKAALKDKVKIQEHALENLTYIADEKVAFLPVIKKTFSSSALLSRFFICLIWWIVSTYVNYGLTVTSVFLPGNKYVNYGLTSLIEIPVPLLTTYLLIRFKRKKPLIAFFLAGTVFCVVQPFTPVGVIWLSVLLFSISRLMCGAYFGITYVFTMELFPTYTRNSMHALCSSLGRFGAIAANNTPLLLHYWSGLPSITFGAASLVAGFVTFFVPDIDDEALPDTVKQAESLGTKQKMKDTGHTNSYIEEACF